MSTDPNEIAEGNNPENLTNAQVGVPEWRLLTEEEILEAGSANLPFVQNIQVFDDPRWIFDVVGFIGNEFAYTYRTKLSRAELRKARGLEPEDHPAIAKVLGDFRQEVLESLTSDLAAERAAHEKTRQEFAKSERALERTVEERDEAQEFASDVYSMMMGEAAEWSNLFGFREAFDALKEARRLLGDAVKSAQQELASVKQGAAQLAEDLAQCVKERNALAAFIETAVAERDDAIKHGFEADQRAFKEGYNRALGVVAFGQIDSERFWQASETFKSLQPKA